MQYGICELGNVPVRNEPANTSEMVSQLLYGELFKIIDERSKWSRIRIAFDSFEGWIDNKQLTKIPEDFYNKIVDEQSILSGDLIDYVADKEGKLMIIPMGSSLQSTSILNHTHDGTKLTGHRSKEHIIETALLFYNSPFLWGGKTPFGIDSSGLTQMVYRLNGYKLFRGAHQQAGQGEALSFIEECEPGDLAFFDDNEGIIDHVGIVMQDNYIIHSYGKVRIDRIDHSGIFNVDLKKHTHKLRVIKKII